MRTCPCHVHHPIPPRPLPSAPPSPVSISPAIRTVHATHHDGNQRQQHGQRRGLAQDDLGQHNVEGWLQRLDRVRQRDGHSRERDVGGHVAHGVHGRRAEDVLELLLGHGLRGRQDRAARAGEKASGKQCQMGGVERRRWGAGGECSGCAGARAHAQPTADSVMLCCPQPTAASSSQACTRTRLLEYYSRGRRTSS